MRLVLFFLCVVLRGEVAAADYPFQRFFTDETERAEIDRKRAAGIDFNELEFDVPVIEEDEEFIPTRVLFGGYVKRNDGEVQYWIDGASDLSNRGGDTDVLILEADRAARLRRGNYRTVLKPGQVWSVEDNQVFESYNKPSLPIVADTPPTEPADEPEL